MVMVQQDPGVEESITPLCYVCAHHSLASIPFRCFLPCTTFLNFWNVLTLERASKILAIASLSVFLDRKPTELRISSVEIIGSPQIIKALLIVGHKLFIYMIALQTNIFVNVNHDIVLLSSSYYSVVDTISIRRGTHVAIGLFYFWRYYCFSVNSCRWSP